MKQALQISWIAIRELVYEKVFYLLFSFVGLALILGILLGQLTFGEQAKLTLDFMLGCTHISMVLFSIFMGISLFQRELQMGSVSMLLSKPVSRTSFLLGKYLGQIAVQLGVILAITAVTVLSCLRFETVHYLALAQAILLIFFETCVITAITYFFSVNTGGILAAMATFVFFALGHYNTASNRKVATDSKPLTEALWSIVPNLEVFNLKTYASYGVTISSKEIVLSSAYALLCCVMFLVLASLTFERKDILT
jgi:ABC-type transport system involved in multi-copper enzyme maturation permease subunit